MRISLPGLGGRLRRARNATRLSQEAVAEKVGVSWMTVHRWEHSQRAVPEETLLRLCDLYGKPLRWFLTLEDGDLAQLDPRYADPGRTLGAIADNSGGYRTGALDGSQGETPANVAERVFRRIADAPADYAPMIERVVEDILQTLSKEK